MREEKKKKVLMFFEKRGIFFNSTQGELQRYFPLLHPLSFSLSERKTREASPALRRSKKNARRTGAPVPVKVKKGR